MKNLSQGTWAYAQRACALKGMELVSIESLEEQLAIAAQISKHENFILKLNPELIENC